MHRPEGAHRHRTLAKIAIFSAGVFFHGAADHVMIATTGRAPDAEPLTNAGAHVWAMAGLDLAFVVALLFLHKLLAPAER